MHDGRRPRSPRGARRSPPSSSGPLGGGAPSGPGSASPTPTTGRTSRSSTTGRPAPTSLWSIVSVVLLLAGIGALVWWRAFRGERRRAAPSSRPPRDPLRRARATPSMRAIAKYLGVVVALFVRAGGARRDHRALHGRGPGVLRLPARGVPALQPDPHLAHPDGACSGSRPRSSPPACSSRRSIGGREPRFQRLGVNVLFGALLWSSPDRWPASTSRSTSGFGSTRRSGSATRATSTSTSAASGRSRSSPGSSSGSALMLRGAVARAARAATSAARWCWMFTGAVDRDRPDVRRRLLLLARART